MSAIQSNTDSVRGTYLAKDTEVGRNFIQLDIDSQIAEGAVIVHDICEFVHPIIINREQVALPVFLDLLNADKEIPGRMNWRERDDEKKVLIITLDGKRLDESELDRIEFKVRELGINTFSGGLSDQRPVPK